MDPDQVDADREAAVTFYRLQPLLFDGTRLTAPLAIWLHDMESVFHIDHIEAHLQVSLASRCFVGDAQLWWIATGERDLPSRTWVHFWAMLIVRYGQVPDQEVDGPYRDPEIYRDMRRTRYFSLAALWHAYPHESMGHYCHRFLDAILPHILQDLEDPEMQALQLI